MLLAPAVAALALAGCAQPMYWAPGPNQTADAFGQTSGQCKLVAMSGGSGTYAVGSPAFVSNAMLMGALANQAQQRNIYSACMEASGFVRVAAPDTSAGSAEASRADPWSGH
jgi:hypothetical protein